MAKLRGLLYNLATSLFLVAVVGCSDSKAPPTGAPSDDETGSLTIELGSEDGASDEALPDKDNATPPDPDAEPSVPETPDS